MKSFIFTIAVCGVACSTAAATPTPSLGSNDASMNRFEHDMLVRFHMHENFTLVRAIERLLLRGKLEETRDLARSIAIAPDEPHLSTWSAQTMRVRDRAAELATAKTLDEAFTAESKLAMECASCHLATGVTPEFATPSQPPPDQATIAARMARHLWAADRLWEGMIGMADDSWRAGLEILAQAPLPAVEMGEVRARFARQLQRLAETARKTTSTDKDRASTYAQLLTQCAACHTSP
jgi:cytochrome c553